jgi:hypothetical protein
MYKALRFSKWYRWHICYCFRDYEFLAGVYEIPGHLWVRKWQTLDVTYAKLVPAGLTFIDGRIIG